MKLNEIKPTRGARHRVKRLGRGDATGHGGTSTRGHKGQKARSGGYHKRGHEGGQMPIQRRLPKVGFNNIFRKEFAVVNLDTLSKLEIGVEVTPELLLEKGVIKKLKDGLKILGRGELKNPIKIKAHKVSKQARAKIEAAGGTVVEVS